MIYIHQIMRIVTCEEDRIETVACDGRPWVGGRDVFHVPLVRQTNSHVCQSPQSWLTLWRTGEG